MAAKHKITFNVPARDVFAVITDFESYPEFIPEVSYAAILEETPQFTIVEFRINVGRTFTYVLKFTPRPYESIKWTYVRGDFRDNSGSWTFSEKGGRTEALYEVSVDLGRLVPKFLMTTIAGIGLSSLLNKYKDRVESGEANKQISLTAEVAAYEKKLIVKYLRRARDDVKQAAERLSLSPTELKTRMKTLDIKEQ